MKMTLHIDEALLARVMEATGAGTKTRAVDLALREMDRRAKLVEICREGLGLTAAELKEAFDPASLPEVTLQVPERPVKPVYYGRKSAAR